MKRKLVYCLIFASTIGTSYVYANMGDVRKDLDSHSDQDLSINSITLADFIINPSLRNTSNFAVDRANEEERVKGKEWAETPQEEMDVLVDPIDVTNKTFNDIDNIVNPINIPSRL